jgi:hypothetical protein
MKKRLRRIFQWKLWAFMISISLLSGALLGEGQDIVVFGIGLSYAGLKAGLFMVLRALVFIIALAMLAEIVSIARLNTVFSKIGLPYLAPALQVAGDAMPSVVEAFGKKPMSWKRPFFYVESAILSFSREGELWGLNSKAPTTLKVHIVTGKPSSGKTGQLKDKIAEIGQANCDGFLQLKRRDGDEILGFDLYDVSSGQTMRLATKRKNQRGYDFSARAFLRARDILANLDPNKVHFVDELGKLESQGYGHMPAVIWAMNRYGGTWYFSVREDCAEAICLNINIPQTSDPA